MMNKYGEKGSPCRRPALHWIQDPGVPLGRIAVLPVWRMFWTHAQKIGGKPLACKIDMREDQQMESNAFPEIKLDDHGGGFSCVASAEDIGCIDKFFGNVATVEEPCLVVVNE